jgi:hypothetical protein
MQASLRTRLEAVRTRMQRGEVAVDGCFVGADEIAA